MRRCQRCRDGISVAGAPAAADMRVRGAGHIRAARVSASRGRCADRAAAETSGPPAAAAAASQGITPRVIRTQRVGPTGSVRTARRRGPAVELLESLGAGNEAERGSCEIACRGDSAAHVCAPFLSSSCPAGEGQPAPNTHQMLAGGYSNSPQVLFTVGQSVNTHA